MIRPNVIDANHVISDVTTMCDVASAFVDVSTSDVTSGLEFEAVGTLTRVGSYMGYRIYITFEIEHMDY